MRRRVRSAVLICGLAVAALLGGGPSSAAPSAPVRVIVPTRKPYPHGGTNTYRAGLQRSNSNAQLAETIPALVRRDWVASPAVHACSRQVHSEFETPTTVTSGRFTVALYIADARCGFVSAYRTKTGKRLWKKEFYGGPARMVSDGKTVYVVNHSFATGYSHVTAYTISSGHRRWRSKRLDTSLDLAVGSGVVVNESVVLSAKTGRLRGVLPPSVEGSGEAGTLVVGGVIYRNTHTTTEALSLTGALLWRHLRSVNPEDDPRRIEVPQVHDGRVYVTSTNLLPTVVLDATTGTLVRELPASVWPLAIDGHVGFFTSLVNQIHEPAAPGEPSTTTISAVDLDDGYVYWTHPYPYENSVGVQTSVLLATPVVVENGLLWSVQKAVHRPPALVALDEVSGRTESSTSLVCTLKGHEAIDVSGTLGVAQHRLFVPGPCGLQTFTAR